MNDPGDENDYKPGEVVQGTPEELRELVFPIDEGRMRQFETGATRNRDEDAYDYEGFLSPIVLQRFAAYMHRHREQADGTLRSSDNWQKGIPVDSYAKSLTRHHMDAWLNHRGYEDAAREDLEDALCAIIFNAQGWLHEIMVGRGD